MANLTITVDDGVLRRARIRALDQGTSVNAILRAYLEAFADAKAEQRALEEFVELAQSARSGSGEGGRAWARGDLHER